MINLILLVRLAGRRIALPAGEVEGVVELEGITPVPRTPDWIMGLSALRSRVVTVVDAAASLGFETEPGAPKESLVVASGGHSYALLLDAVEDVVEADGEVRSLDAPVGPGWERVALGLVEADGELLLLVDPHVLIAGPLAAAARA